MKIFRHHRDFCLIRPLMAILFFFSTLLSHAQSMSVSSFKEDESDQTANVNPTMRTDINGEKCALIKVVTTQKNFSFDVGTLGITEVVSQNAEHPSEIWVYVPNGAMKITIQHPQFGVIKDYDFGLRLKKGRTYVLELTSDQVNTLVVDYDNSQFLDVSVYPTNADFFINGIKQSLDYNGKLTMQLPFGTHNYRVVANDYHTEESQIVINDKENKQTLNVRLKQAFGYLNVEASDESKGGQLYIDDIKVGEIPLSNFPLKSGLHEISILQKLYMPYREKIAMTDSSFVSIKPVLEPNYAEYEISVGDKDAKIYDNGELLGTGHWKGKLEAGNHIIEARKISHTTITEKIDVVKDEKRNVSLSTPMPIYGTLEIQSTPNNAIVYIDGKEVGQTSYINSHILIGQHNIQLKLKGHKTEEFDVDIKEGQTERKTIPLTDYCQAIISSTPSSQISIDDVYQGKTPYNVNRVAGEYTIELSAYGYTKYRKKMRLDGTTKDMNIKLHRNYIRDNEFYMQGGYNVVGSPFVTAGMGGYIKNINIEANYVTSLSSSDNIYWCDTSGEKVPFSATYKPQGGNVKFGYGIRLNSRFRVTPQIGCQFIKLKETAEKSNSSSDYSSWSEWYYGAADNAGAASLTAGLRINIGILSCVGIAVTPEYILPVSQSEGFKALSDVSSTIKAYSSGFNCNVCLNLFF